VLLSAGRRFILRANKSLLSQPDALELSGKTYSPVCGLQLGFELE
jgi:hypothetical protein